MNRDLPTTRRNLQLLATHILARRRHAVTGRFGLRPAPGGLATPAFGDDIEVIRVDGRFLVHERGGTATVEPISTLGAAAELVGADLSAEFTVGADTPSLTSIDEPLALDDGHVRTVGAWWSFGAEVIDEAIGTTPAAKSPTVLQLWPEHFDLGGGVTVEGSTLNVGASPGDAFEPLPYLYVGPWSSDRPGVSTYWNAPFGAVLRAAELPTDRRRAAAVEFVREGLTRFA